MAYFETNNDFFGYNGTINRKNYVINMTIMFAVVIGLSFVNFSFFSEYTSFKFLFVILDFVIGLVKFVVIFAMLSLVYRRFMDISKSKSYKFMQNVKKLFITLFVFPVIYIFCIRMFIYTIPVIPNILDLLSYYMLVPAALLSALVISFLK